MKKYFQIMNSNPQVNKGKVKIDGRDLKFHKKTNTFYTHDEGLAREIEAENPKWGFAKATVVEVPQSMTKVNEGTRHQHNYFFSVPDLSKIKGMSCNEMEDDDAIKKRKVQKGDKPKHKRTRTFRETTEAGDCDCDECC